MEGWIKIGRKLLDWEWYDTPGMVELWIHLLLRANYEDRKWRGGIIKRGQLITSVSALSEERGYSVKQIRTMLTRLEDSGCIVKQGTNKYTIITICNYDTYQTFEDDEGQAKGEQRANEGQAKGEQEERFSPDPFSKDIKEGKKEKETSDIDKSISLVKKEAGASSGEKKRFVKPTVDEVQEYCSEKGYAIDAEAFIAHYESNGWRVGNNPMKSWKGAVVTWVKSPYRSNEKQAPARRRERMITINELMKS